MAIKRRWIIYIMAVITCRHLDCTIRAKIAHVLLAEAFEK